MDFLTRLPMTRSYHDTIWVIVDWLMKWDHFLSTRITNSLEKLAQLYIRELVRLHEVPDFIVSNQNPRFTAHFCGSFYKALGTRIYFSTTLCEREDHLGDFPPVLGKSPTGVATLIFKMRANQGQPNVDSEH